MKQIAILAMVLISAVAYGQTKTETIKRELSFEKKGTHNALLIANINGSITVEGYSGDVVVVEVEKIISGKTPERLAKGVEEIGLGVIDRADTLILYVEGICPPFGKNANGKGSHFGKWGYNWENCGDRNPEFDYKLNFKIRVPSAVNLHVSTINEGSIAVEKMAAKVIANNINGAIRLTDLTAPATAHTINGDVEITYLSNPKGDCRFYTLNGDINANFKKGLSSDVTFKSYNGEFYTNIDKLVALPVKVDKKSSDRGIKYTVNGNHFQTGSGGALLDFETFNGDVYLKEN